MKTLLLILFVIVSFAGVAQKAMQNSCIDVTSGPGYAYQPDNTLNVSARNNCEKAMEVKICIQTYKKDRSIKWNCGIVFVEPGELQMWGWGDSNGKYKVFSKVKGDYGTSFPNEDNLPLSDTDN